VYACGYPSLFAYCLQLLDACAFRTCRISEDMAWNCGYFANPNNWDVPKHKICRCGREIRGGLQFVLRQVYLCMCVRTSACSYKRGTYNYCAYSYCLYSFSDDLEAARHGTPEGGEPKSAYESFGELLSTMSDLSNFVENFGFCV